MNGLNKKGSQKQVSERIVYERSAPSSSTNLCFKEVMKEHKTTTTCWGCQNYANASMPDTPISVKNFFSFAYGTFSSTDEDEYYLNLQAYFCREIQGAIILENKNYKEDSPHRQDIPEWESQSMREHFEHHCLNPSIQNCIDIKRIKVLIDIAYDSVVAETEDGTKTVDPKQVKNLEMLYKLLDTRFSSNISTQNFYDPGSSAHH